MGLGKHGVAIWLGFTAKLLMTGGIGPLAICGPFLQNRSDSTQQLHIYACGNIKGQNFGCLKAYLSSVVPTTAEPAGGRTFAAPNRFRPAGETKDGERPHTRINSFSSCYRHQSCRSKGVKTSLRLFLLNTLEGQILRKIRDLGRHCRTPNRCWKITT
nr:hypothetical protein Iba_chr06eCG8210 [Ipomoea batatas]